MRRIDYALIGLVILLMVFLVLSVTTINSDSGQDPQQSPSSVQISSVTGIEISLELAMGIDFGSREPGTLDINGSDNYQFGAVGPTLYSVSKSASATVDVYACIFADGDLTETLVGSDTIPLMDERYHNSTINTGPDILLGQAFPLSPGEIASGKMTDVDPDTYYRFWLSVTDPLQAPGLYTNNIFIVPSEDPTCAP